MKNTKIIVFVSALLCAVMALSSCTGSAALPNNDVLANGQNNESVIVPTESENTENNTPTIDTTTAAGKLAVWQQYIKFNSTEKSGLTSGYTDSFSKEGGYNYNTDSVRYGTVIQTYEHRTHGEFEELWKTIFDKSVRVINVFTNKVVYSHSVEYVGNIENEEEVFSDVTIVNVDRLEYGAFCVETINWDPVYEELPEGSTETPEILDYTIKSRTYSFYLNDGTLMGTSESRYDFSYYTRPGVYTFYVDGYAYSVNKKDGSLISKVPEYLFIEEPILVTSINTPDEIEKFGKYSLVRDYFANAYFVFDENGAYINYLDLGDIDSFEILPNGNILTQNTVKLDENIGTYDFYDYEFNTKYDLVTEIIDVATGKVTSVDFNYIIDTVSDDTTDYAVVAAYAIKDQMLASEYTYLALNSDLSVKEELPEIIPMQNGLVSCVDADTVLIPATTSGDESYSYRVTDGNFFAFDFNIADSCSAEGMLFVYDEDEDGYHIRCLVDYNGKYIVNNVTDYKYLYNDDGKIVSVLLVSYDEEEELTRYDICYYDKDNDEVIKRNLGSYDLSEAKVSYYDFLQSRTVRLDIITSDSGDPDYSLKFFDAYGNSLYSLSAESKYGNTYYDNDSGYEYTTTVAYYDDMILVTKTKSGSDNDYIHFTTIK